MYTQKMMRGEEYELAVTMGEDVTESHVDQIQWKQLMSLAALYASVIIGWIAYYNYQPRLLQQYGFTQLGPMLLIAQGIILTITPAVAGKIGDQCRANYGHRIPVISGGISFVAMIFMSVSFVLYADPGETLRWILPVLILLWLIGMSIFTSPALSTLELFTPIHQMPQGMALLTVVGNLVYSLEPVIVDIIDHIGAPATFFLGGVVVMASGFALKKNSIALFKTQSKPIVQVTDSRDASVGKTVLMGVALGLFTTIVFNVIPDALASRWKDSVISGIAPKYILMMLLGFSALVSIPLSRMRMRSVFLSWKISLLINMVSLVLLLLSDHVFLSVLFSLFYVSSFTMQSITSLPLVIRQAPERQKVFHVGLFFGGIAAVEGIYQVLNHVLI